jgi:hypothetical protein
MRKRIGPTPDRAERITLSSILAHNQVGRHWVYSGHYPRIFVAPKNAQNAETKRWSGAVPIPLIALLALMTSAYTSLGVLQELNSQPQLLKALVYHSATSAVIIETFKPESKSTQKRLRLLMLPIVSGVLFFWRPI